jgi:hypothetical protein
MAGGSIFGGKIVDGRFFLARGEPGNFDQFEVSPKDFFLSLFLTIIAAGSFLSTGVIGFILHFNFMKYWKTRKNKNR